MLISFQDCRPNNTIIIYIIITDLSYLIYRCYDILTTKSSYHDGIYVPMIGFDLYIMFCVSARYYAYQILDICCINKNYTFFKFNCQKITEREEIFGGFLLMIVTRVGIQIGYHYGYLRTINKN